MNETYRIPVSLEHMFTVSVHAGEISLDCSCGLYRHYPEITLAELISEAAMHVGRADPGVELTVTVEAAP